MQEALGSNYQEKVGDCLKAYYGLLNYLCALGDVEKMYIPPWMNRKATVLENQLLYEQSVVQDIGISAGNKGLDLGCGRGRVAPHMSQYSGAHITGLNIEPGAYISLLGWVRLPAYDAEKLEHTELMRRVKPLIGAIGTPTPESLGNALTASGFEVVRSENASIDGLQAPPDCRFLLPHLATGYSRLDQGPFSRLSPQDLDEPFVSSWAGLHANGLQTPSHNKLPYYRAETLGINLGTSLLECAN